MKVDVVDLYADPPEHALVLSVPIQGKKSLRRLCRGILLAGPFCDRGDDHPKLCCIRLRHAEPVSAVSELLTTRMKQNPPQTLVDHAIFNCAHNDERLH